MAVDLAPLCYDIVTSKHNETVTIGDTIYHNLTALFLFRERGSRDDPKPDDRAVSLICDFVYSRVSHLISLLDAGQLLCPRPSRATQFLYLVYATDLVMDAVDEYVKSPQVHDGVKSVHSHPLLGGCMAFAGFTQKEIDMWVQMCASGGYNDVIRRLKVVRLQDMDDDEVGIDTMVINIDEMVYRHVHYHSLCMQNIAICVINGISSTPLGLYKAAIDSNTNETTMVFSREAVDYVRIACAVFVSVYNDFDQMLLEVFDHECVDPSGIDTLVVKYRLGLATRCLQRLCDI